MGRERLAGVGRGVIDELVAFALGRALWSGDRLARGRAGLLPRLATVVGTLDDLAEPAAGLRRIQPIRVSRRAFEVINLPARKVGAADLPPIAFAVRGQDERALLRAYQ